VKYRRFMSEARDQADEDLWSTRLPGRSALCSGRSGVHAGSCSRHLRPYFADAIARQVIEHGLFRAQPRGSETARQVWFCILVLYEPRGQPAKGSLSPRFGVDSRGTPTEARPSQRLEKVGRGPVEAAPPLHDVRGRGAVLPHAGRPGILFTHLAPACIDG